MGRDGAGGGSGLPGTAARTQVEGGGAEQDPQGDPQPCTQATLLKLGTCALPSPAHLGCPGWSGSLSVPKCPIWGEAGDFRESDGEELS